MKPTSTSKERLASVLNRLRGLAFRLGIGRFMKKEALASPPVDEPKPPPEIPLFFMVSHLEDDGIVRLDGVKVAACEVMGLEIDEPKLGAFAGALNACDFPFQLLIRQHPPRLGGTERQARGDPAGRPTPTDEGGLGVAPAAPDRP